MTYSETWRHIQLTSAAQCFIRSQSHATRMDESVQKPKPSAARQVLLDIATIWPRRLTGVQEDGASVSSYTYDTNSNRLTAKSPQAGSAGTYDSQDRLRTYGDASFSYAANGELASQSVGLQSTS